MSDRAGQILSHYRLDEKIGEGGMGVVYRARNLNLACDVAVKLLRPGLFSDESARQRFHREAMALSRLNHHNIARVNDFDTHEGEDFLVMEYVPGQTLANLLASGRMPERDVVHLATQVAEGLAVAHENGVVHRDLKPGNLRVTPNHDVKILDFGLAKLLPPPQASETVTLSESTGGGTVHYMSPEQALRQSIDARSDIFSLGVVLYEMTTGRLPFSAPLRTEVVEEILHRQVQPPRSLVPSLSSELEAIILRALEKNRDVRYQSARQIADDLKRLAQDKDKTTNSERRWVRMIAAVAAIAATIALWRIITQRPDSPLQARVLPLVASSNQDSKSRIVPGGNHVSFVSNHDGNDAIWWSSVAGGEPRLIASAPGSITSHIWSPAGDRVALILRGDAGVLLQVLSVAGGPPLYSFQLDRQFADGRLVRWPTSGIYIEVPVSGLWHMPLDGSTPELHLAAMREGGRRADFDVCGDETKILFTLHSGQSSGLWIANQNGHNEKRVVSDPGGVFCARWMGPDCRSLVYSSASAGPANLWRLDLRKGTNERITFGGRIELIDDVSADGSTLTFQQRQDRSELWLMDAHTVPALQRQLTFVDGEDLWPCVVAGTRTIAFQRSQTSPVPGPHVLDAQIFLAELGESGLENPRLLVLEGGDAHLSPDGTRLSFMKRGQERYELWLADVRSGHTWRVAERVSVPPVYAFPVDRVRRKQVWDSDGLYLYCVLKTESGLQELHRIETTTGVQRLQRLAVSEPAGILADPYISPDGRRLAYVSSCVSDSVHSEIRCLELASGRDVLVASHNHDTQDYLLLRGWLDASSLLFLLTRSNPDWSEDASVLVAGLDGTVRQLMSIPRSFAGTAILDAASAKLYITCIDDDRFIHNLYAVDLARAEIRRLTENVVPGVSFSGSQVLTDGRVVCARYRAEQSVWAIRFER